MPRRSASPCKVTRSWTKSSITAASAHFPNAVKADPASLRNAETSAKERSMWTLSDGVNDASKIPRHVNWMIQKISMWGRLIRFDKPVGTYLLMLPSYWGVSLAVTQSLVWEGADPVVLFAPFIPVHLFVLFGVGAMMLRSAGCIINDMWDRKFDRMVERTKTRPLASGEMTMPEAFCALAVHLLIGLVIAMNLSPVALITAMAIVPMVVIYPLMKRITYMPQIILGMCFNASIFVGYAAVLNRIDWAVTLPIYCASILWTVLYDTIYAYQDIDDDLKCGVKSLAILVGDRKHLLMALIAPIGFGMMLSGLMVSQSLPYYFAVLLCIYYLQGIVDDVNIHDKWTCATGFWRNVNFGFFILLSMWLGNVFWALASEQQIQKDMNSNASLERSSLMNFLLLNKEAESMSYNVQDVRWIDRFAHPAFVAAQQKKNESNAVGELVIPPWMRREYLGENLGTILHFCGVEGATIRSWQEWWYAQLDHYNMFSTISI